jgi:hypothetical protein
MEIKKYQDWLFETTNYDPECGCTSVSIIEQSTTTSTPSTGGAAYTKSDKTQTSGKIPLNYSAGYYSVNHTNKSGQAFDNESKIKPELEKVIEFLKANPGSYIATAKLVVGESLPPNFDSEGAAGSTVPRLKAKQGTWLETGDLADLRVAKLESWLKTQLAPLKSAGIIKQDPYVIKDFRDAKSKIAPSGGWDDYRNWKKGAGEWKTPMDNTTEKGKEYTKLKTGYDKDQFAEVYLQIRAYSDPSCLLGMWIGFHYDVANGHSCNNSRFEIKANGITLTTVTPPTKKLETNVDSSWALPAGMKYASLNNQGKENDEYAVAYKREDRSNLGGSAWRLNWFKISDKALADKIIAAAGPDKNIKITATCIKPITYPDGKIGYDGVGGCHTTAPHVYVLSKDEVKTSGFPTYPNTNDGIIATTDFCGRNLGVQITTPPKTKPDGAQGGGFQLPKETGIKLLIGSRGTLSAEQRINNLLTAKTLYKKPDSTYIVLKAWTENGISYQVGDVINGTIKPNVKYTPPPTRVDAATAPKN